MTAKLFVGVRRHPRAAIATTGLLVLALFSAFLALPGGKASGQPSHETSKKGSATGLGQLSGLLPTDHLVLESAIQVDLTHETIRLPLYPGRGPDGQPVWFVLLESSDAGLGPRPGRELCPQTGRYRHRLPRMRADRHA